MSETPSPSIVLANEPRAYRQVLAGAIRAGHHGVEIVEVSPEHLDAAMSRHDPVLVICDTLTPVIEAQAPMWVLLYPDGARLVVTSVHGVHRYAADLDLAELDTLIGLALRQVGTTGVGTPPGMPAASPATPGEGR